MTPGWVIEAALCHALTTAGAPAAWTEISQLAVSRQNPLAALDVHPVDPIVKSNPKGSEK